MEDKNLKTLLAEVKPEMTAEQVANKFNEIANELFKYWHIEKGNDCYDFLEIEFYYYSKEHPDYITYPRDTKAGLWFFHPSGVDITFESKSDYEDGKDKPKAKLDDYFGGILIRSLLKNGTDIYTGPQICVNEVFDKVYAFDTNGWPTIKNTDCSKTIPISNSARNIRPFILGVVNSDWTDKAQIKKAETVKSRYPEEFDRDTMRKYVEDRKYRYYNADYEKELKK
ncbi:MAG: hypothetical protein LBL81_01870 [Tannerella sp.]|jgi:hypothetical protein|nr:hypothetical protein [Tannerella sp.]